MEEKKKRKLGPKKIILLISIIISIVLVLTCLGKELVMPFPSNVQLDSALTAYIQNGKPSVVVDAQGTRLIFLDNDKKVKNMVKLDNASAVDKVNGIVCDDNYCYVSGVKYEKNTRKAVYDRVAKFDLNGNALGTVYEESIQFKTNRGVIRNIVHDNGALYVTKNDWFDESKGQSLDNIIISVVKLDVSSSEKANKTKGETIFRSEPGLFYWGTYDPSTKDILMLDLSGDHILMKFDGNKYEKTYPGHFSDTTILPVGDGRYIYVNDYTREITVDKDVIASNVIVARGSINLHDSKMCYYDNLSASFYVYNLATGEMAKISQLDFSLAFTVECLLKLLAVAWLAILIVVFIIKSVIKAYKEKKFVLLKRVCICVLATIVLTSVAVYYTGNIVSNEAKNIKSETQMMATFFKNTLDQNTIQSLKSNIEGTLDEQEMNLIREKYIMYDQYYGEFTSATAETGKFSFVELFVDTDEGKRVVYDSTFDFSLGSAVPVEKESSIKADIFSILSGANDKAITYITDAKDESGNTIATVAVGLDYAVTAQRVFDMCLQMTLNLLIGFAVVYVVIIELIALIKGIKERKESIKKRVKCPELSIMHSISFLFKLAFGFTGVIEILIIRELCVASGYDAATTTTMMALPALIEGIGYTIGSLTFGKLGRKIYCKSLTIVTTAIAGAMFVMMAFAISTGNFALFCLFTLVQSVTSGIAYRSVDVLPLRAEDEATRYKSGRESSLAGVSSSILGALIGAAAADALGNASVYLISAFAIIPAILILLFALPNKTILISPISNTNEAKGAKKSNLTNKLKFFFSVPMISYFLFLFVPLVVVAGYKSFLFPIYSSAVSMSKTDITSFYVISRAVMLLIQGPVSKVFEKRLDHWGMAISGVLLFGLFFLGFALNSTIIWAIIMLLITTLLMKIVTPQAPILYGRYAEVHNLSAIEVSNPIEIITDLMFSFQQPILVLFLAFSDEGACVAVGVFCVICSLLFAVFTFRSPMSLFSKKTKSKAISTT